MILFRYYELQGYCVVIKCSCHPGHQSRVLLKISESCLWPYTSIVKGTDLAKSDLLICLVDGSFDMSASIYDATTHGSGALLGDNINSLHDDYGAVLLTQ